MPVVTPGRRPAYPPIGRLRASSLSGGKKSGFVSLNLTPMVDMFTILVIFLIQMFSSDTVTVTEDVQVPKAVSGSKLEEAGTLLVVNKDGQITVVNAVVPETELGAPTDVLMPGVSERLKKIREADEDLKKRLGTPRDMEKPYEGILIVQADVKADFKVVRRVLFSANDAGWAKIKFVTLPDSEKASSQLAAEKAAEE
jgi:biopolymer transport protein ExbD